jgi:cytochrome c2
MLKKMLIILPVLLLLLAACGGGGEAAPQAPAAIGDAARGEELFKQQVIGANASPGCITCHSLEPDVVIVGPSQYGLGARAETRVAGLSAEEYIRQSICEPDAYVVEGFSPGLMYMNYCEDLQARDVNDIIAYTLTLR